MTDNSKYYDYYMVEGEQTKKLIADHKEINKQRNVIINQITDEFGAVAFTDTSSFGNAGGFICNLAWKADHEFPCQITVKAKNHLEPHGEVIVARGKGNTKDGREFNKKLDAAIKSANEKLEKLPSFKSFIISHYGIMKTGFGAPAGTGFGISMLTTYGGRIKDRDDCLLFAIPNKKDEWNSQMSGDVTIPCDFKKLTYGQFYDLVNSD